LISALSNFFISYLRRRHMQQLLRQFMTVMVISCFLLALHNPVLATDQKVGIVLLHGKWGNPRSLISGLASDLRDAGFMIQTPEMPWSGNRLYDKGIDDAMREIDSAITTLRKQGATTILVAGHSLGAMGALRYCGTRQVNGLIMLAPGNNPESKVFRSKTATDVAQAREMVAAGTPDKLIRFIDMNTGGRRKEVMANARVFLDYFSPDGPMNSQNNARVLRPDIPVLWIVGSHEEEGPRIGGEKVRAVFPPQTALSFIEIKADHMQTPDYAADSIINWIKALKQP
jgi:pimeloyl-ACP methyl ester carboxylesterase